jgi:hypothetical protein
LTSVWNDVLATQESICRKKQQQPQQQQRWNCHHNNNTNNNNKPSASTRPMCFHHPVFWTFSGFSKQALETNIVNRADAMMKALRDHNVTTLGHALSVIFHGD